MPWPACCWLCLQNASLPLPGATWQALSAAGGQVLQGHCPGRPPEARVAGKEGTEARLWRQPWILLALQLCLCPGGLRVQPLQSSVLDFGAEGCPPCLSSGVACPARSQQGQAGGCSEPFSHHSLCQKRGLWVGPPGTGGDQSFPFVLLQSLWTSQLWEGEESACPETLSSGHFASGQLALWGYSERDKVELGPWRQAEEETGGDTSAVGPLTHRPC